MNAFLSLSGAGLSMSTPLLARLSLHEPIFRALPALTQGTLALHSVPLKDRTSDEDSNQSQLPCLPTPQPTPVPCWPLDGALRHRVNPRWLASIATVGGSVGPHAKWPTGRSFASQAAPQEPPQRPQPTEAPEVAGRPPHDVSYVGPLSQQHKLLKRISIANTLVALAAAPAIVAWADNISMVSRYGLAASLVFFGMITTGALHWVAHPYVHELRYTAATGQIDVRTTTLFGNSRWHSFNVDDVRPLPWNRPVATFTALGNFYYIDTFNFPDEQLLRRLTPDEADVPKGFKDEDEDD